MKRSSVKLSVVLPCFNEASHLSETLETIRDQLSFMGNDVELLVIDDGSTDNTWAVIQDRAQSDACVRGLRLSRRFGKEYALCAGLERARGQAVVVMDSDLQHPPSLIQEMVRAWEEGYEVVEAVKEDRGREPLAARLAAGIFYGLLRRLSDIDLRGASDFKLLDRKVLEAWASLPERNVFFRGMSAWIGFRRKTLPFIVGPRASGDTRWSTTALLKLALTGIMSFSSVPIHLVTVMGGLFFLFSVALGIQAFAKKLTGEAVTGFTTVIILQLVIGSMVMISLGILGAYVSKIYNEVKGRPRYVLAETTDSASAADREGALRC